MGDKKQSGLTVSGGGGLHPALARAREDALEALQDGSAVARLRSIMAAPGRNDSASLGAWDRLLQLAQLTVDSEGQAVSGETRVYVLVPGQSPPPNAVVLDAAAITERARQELLAGGEKE